MKIIVTRPQLEAELWVKQLRTLRIDAIALPLIQIDGLANKYEVIESCEKLQQYHAVMFVSANAVRYFYTSKNHIAGDFIASNAIKNITKFENFDKHPRMWATGLGTRDALLAQSIPVHLIDSPDLDVSQFDSEALWSQVENQVKVGDKVLIVRGSTSISGANSQSAMDGRPWLADQLTAAGVQVDFLVCYQRSIPKFTSDELNLIMLATVDKSVWLLSSSEAVTNLKTIPNMNLSHARAIATHPRIAFKAREAGFGVVYESRPLLTDVVASIESLI